MIKFAIIYNCEIELQCAISKLCKMILQARNLEDKHFTFTFDECKIMWSCVIYAISPELTEEKC